MLNKHEVCPTCNRKFVAPKSSDKKLSQDIARAERAIAILDDYVSSNRYGLGDACQSEATRLRRAVQSDHNLLWSIYRRSDKASGYGISFFTASQEKNKMKLEAIAA